MLLGVFIVFVKAHLDILSLHFPDEPNNYPCAQKTLEREIRVQRKKMRSVCYKKIRLIRAIRVQK